MLPIVDDNGVVTAQAPRSYCHGGSRLLHPVVHLHILNRNGELYLQRRGAHKSLLPLKWDSAVGGHISYGEYTNEALHREAEEELGLLDFYPYHLLSYIYESERERELVNVFAAVGNFNPRPDPIELSGGRYWSEIELASALHTGILTPNFESEYAQIKDSLYALL